MRTKSLTEIVVSISSLVDAPESGDAHAMRLRSEPGVRIRERDARVEPLVRQARPLTAGTANRRAPTAEGTREP